MDEAQFDTIDIRTRFKAGDFVWFITGRDSEGAPSTVQRGLVLPEVTVKVDTVNKTREVRHALQVVQNGMARTYHILDTAFVGVIAL